MRWVAFPVIWVIVLMAWAFLSLFLHELFHLGAAVVCKLEVTRFRLLTIPGRGKGYVDVLIPKGTKYYLLKRGLVHLSGIIAHIKLALISFLLFSCVQGIIFRGIYLEGIVVNAYLVIINIFPEDSDGRKFWEMLKKA